MNATPEILLDRDAVRDRVEALASRIGDDHPGGVVLVGVLKGALLFTADLARAMARTHPSKEVLVDFLAISRYAPDSGRVRLLRDLDVDVAGRAVVLVEDLVDTGLTAAYLLEHLRRRNPDRVDLCTMLDRAERRVVPVQPRYVGEQIPGDAFVLGYGLHLGERYRNLPMIVRADREALVDDPDALLPLYRVVRRSGTGAMLGSPTTSERRHT